LLTADEREQLLVEWNRTEAEYPDDKCLADLIEGQANRTPERWAVVSAEGRLITNLLISYDKLDEGLEMVANRIGVAELTKLPRANASPQGIGRNDLTREQQDWIEHRFRKDKEFIERHANKIANN